MAIKHRQMLEILHVFPQQDSIILLRKETRKAHTMQWQYNRIALYALLQRGYKTRILLI